MMEPRQRPPLDRAEGLRHVGGREKLLNELIGVFLADVPRLRGLIRAALAESSATALASAAHALKGSASAIGATEISRLAHRLQELAHSANLAEADALQATLEVELNRVAVAAKELHAA